MIRTAAFLCFDIPRIPEAPTELGCRYPGKVLRVTDHSDSRQQNQYYSYNIEVTKTKYYHYTQWYPYRQIRGPPKNACVSKRKAQAAALAMAGAILQFTLSTQ